MGSKSKIEWTDATWNPIIGCSRVSEGCRNCYAETIVGRFGRGKPTVYSGLTQIVNGRSVWTGKIKETRQLLQPMKWRQPRKVFVNSMSDLFHENVADEQIDTIFAVMTLSPRHTFQVLTKRPKRMMEYMMQVEEERDMQRWINAAVDLALDFGSDSEDCIIANNGWPPRNIWLGVSVENQAAADERIPLLLKTPAAVRFISAEPLLGPVNLQDIRYQDEDVDCLWKSLTAYHEVLNSTSMDVVATEDDGVTKLDWVICGGESGPNARPMKVDWARSLRNQCAGAKVPFFFKQWGEWGPNWLNDDAGGKIQETEHLERMGKRITSSLLDGREHKEFPAG